MKSRVNFLAISVALASLAGTASAGLLPSTYGFAGGVPVDLEVKIAGASAPDVALKDLINNVCVAGSLTTFSDTTGKDVGSSYSAYFCQIDDTKVTGLTQGQPGQTSKPYVLFRKRSAGGSYQGTTPLAFARQDQTQMNVDSTHCALDSGSRYKCDSTSTFTTIADAGTSDLPPGEFISPNIATGQSGCGTACTGNLNAASNYALTMGIIADTSLYVALQKAQGLNSDTDANGTADVAEQAAFVAANPAAPTAAEQTRINNYIANMPSLRTDQVAALSTGTIYRWNKVFYKGTALTATAGVTAPTDQRVFVCRRVAGSGTQSTVNALVLNVPCSASADFPKTDNTACVSATGTPTGATGCAGTETWAAPASSSIQAVIHEASGSGDVDNCLSALNDNATPIWGLGIMGLDRSPIAKTSGGLPDTTKATKWSFIKIDGAAPTLDRVASGNYQIWAGESMQWRNKDWCSNATADYGNGVGNGQAAPCGGSDTLVPALSGDALTLVSALRTNAGNATELNTINQSLFWPFGLAGTLDLTNTTVRPFSATLPVMQYTRGGKTCNTNKAISASTAAGQGVDFDN